MVASPFIGLTNFAGAAGAVAAGAALTAGFGALDLAWAKADGARARLQRTTTAGAIFMSTSRKSGDREGL
jgi:hypothetical protein